MKPYQLLFSLFLSVFLPGCEKPVPSTADDFFYVPWPSDTRLESGRHIFSSGQKVKVEYPGAESGFDFNFFRMLGHHFVYQRGAKKMEEQKYGVNSGIHFSLAYPIDESQIQLEPLATQSSDSPVQLVNVDSESDQFHSRVPLLLDFKPTGTVQRPSNALTLLPYQGFTLAFHSQYAAIVFNDVYDAEDLPFAYHQLYEEIKQPWHDEMSITLAQHTLWQYHRSIVEEYAASIGRSMDDVVAFTVFSTQDPARITLDFRDALHTLSDEDIRNMVVYDPIETSENPILDSPPCGDADLDGLEPGWVQMFAKLKLPRWQSGIFPYLLAGGQTRYEMNDGKINIPAEYEVVPVNIAIPCDASNGPNPYVISQQGSNSDAQEAVEMVTWDLFDHMYETDSIGASDVMVIGIGDLISGTDRRGDPGIQNALQLARLFEGAAELGDNSVLPAIRNGYFNAVAARGNMRQAAAESYILKRVAENLVEIVAETIPPENVSAAGLTLDHFRVDKNNRVGLAGFSQGANNGFVNMAMDSEYDFAYFASGVGIDLPLVAFRPEVQQLVQTIFPALEYGELDLFHPIGSFVQTAFEPMDSSNYARYARAKNIFLTAGYFDTQVPALSTEHMAVSLARLGRMQATGVSNSGDLLDVYSFPDVLGIPLIRQFPISGNILDGEGTAIFSLGNHAHVSCGDVGGFIYSASRGGAATIGYPCGE